VLALAAVAAGAGAAAGQVPDSVVPLGSVEATVARGAHPVEQVPFAISVVEPTGLHPAMPAVDLQELLRRVPGVVVSNRHNLAMDTRIAVRGFGARSAFGVRGVRILLDGIPLTLPDGQAALTNVDPGSIGRIEVLRGPAAALYGNAAGGVIAMTTMEPPAGGYLEGRAAVGTYGTADLANLVRLQGNAGGMGQRDAWFVGVSHLSSAGYRDHSRAERTGVTGRYRRAVGERTAVTVVANVANVPVALNPGSIPLDSMQARPRMAWPQNVATRASKEVAQAQGGAAFTHRFDAAVFEAAAYGLGRKMDNPLAFGRYIRLDRRGGGARVLARAPDLEAVTWTVGVEVQGQSDDRLERDNQAGEMAGPVHQDRVDRVASAAAFGFVQLPLHSRFSIRAGTRYDAVVFDSDNRLGATPEDRSARRTLDALSGSVGGLAAVGERGQAWASVSSWFQTPTTTELINTPPPTGEPCCPTGFNPDLDPQDGWGVEAGVRGRSRRLGWEVVGFDLRARNEILPFQVEGIPGRDFYRNAGRSTYRGIEVAGTLSAGGGWSAEIGYAFSDFRFIDPPPPASRGDRLPGIPPHRVDAGLAWLGHGWNLRLDAEWADRTPANDANTGFAPAYTVLDLRVSRRLTPRGAEVEPFMAITNLTDARYSGALTINAFGGRYHEPAPARALLLGVRARFR
jgi:iron complex outermembrane recepter protein